MKKKLAKKFVKQPSLKKEVSKNSLDLVKEVTSKLSESELLNKALFNASLDCVKILDTNGHLINMNEQGLKIMEIDDFKKFEGASWIDFWNGQDGKSVKKAIQNAKSGKRGHFQGFTPTAKGNPRWWDVTVLPIYNSQGKVKQLLSLSRDITKEKEDAEILVSTKNRFEALLDKTPAFVAQLKGKEHIFEYSNTQYSQLVGFRDIVGKSVKDALPEVVEQGFITMLDDVYRSKKPFMGNEIEVKIQAKKNASPQLRYVNFIFQPIISLDKTVSGIFVHGVDITNQVLARRKAEDSEKEITFLSDSIPQQVWTAKPNGELDYVNKYTENYFNKSAAEIVGNGWQTVIHPDDLPECFKLWTHSLKTGDPYQVLFRLLKSDGGYRWHLGRAVPLKNGKKIEKWYGSNTDVHEQKKLESQKDDFIGIASHELKTPVTSIKAYTQLLEKKFLRVNDQQSADLVSKMDAQLNKLSNLISDLLDITKIESGRLQLNTTKLDFNKVIRDVVEDLQRTSDKHKILYKPAKAKTVYSDSERIGQVLTNFLSNAIKYSPHSNKIVVRTSSTKKDVTVSVEDFGVGISKEKQPMVFERFYRISGPTHDTFPGLGLGLYISAEIIKRLNGKIWVISKKGKGSTFCFSLPIKQ